MAQVLAMNDASPNHAKRWAWVRLILGFVQMFGAVVSLALVIFLGVVPLTLISLIATGMVTTVSIMLFGKAPFGLLRKRMDEKR